MVYPFLWVDEKLRSKSQLHTEDSPSTEDEVIHLINAQSDAELEDEEREIIRSVFEFGDTVVREIMTPRVDIVGIKDDTSWEACLKLATDSPHSRFPVYHESLDEIIGMIHIKDLLKRFSSKYVQTNLHDFIKKMEFAPETMPLKTKRAHQVVVVDEYGGTAGLVTLEDVLEELVGNIEDEYDHNTREITQRSDGTYLINAKVLVDQLNDELALSLPESDEYDSIGGFICDHFGYIPAVGEEIRISSVKIKIQQASPRTINLIQLSMLADEE
jgi:CBS domain containing-hemolysin-like protein